MVKEFKDLREDEIEVLMKAPIYVAILIAGADGEIDSTEKKEAISIANNRQSRSREQLNEYFKLINFDRDFDKIVSVLPSGT
jgi:tellurite resistance protein